MLRAMNLAPRSQAKWEHSPYSAFQGWLEALSQRGETRLPKGIRRLDWGSCRAFEVDARGCLRILGAVGDLGWRVGGPRIYAWERVGMARCWVGLGTKRPRDPGRRRIARTISGVLDWWRATMLVHARNELAHREFLGAEARSWDGPSLTSLELESKSPVEADACGLPPSR